METLKLFVLLLLFPFSPFYHFPLPSHPAIVNPPLTDSTCPVTKSASGEAKKATALAISSGWPRRRNGTARVMASMIRAPLSPEVTCLSKAVSVGPGQTTLTLILDRASSRARVLEKPITPALQAEYTASPVEPTRPASELIEMILPALRAIIWGITAWQKLIGPFRLMAMTLSQVSGL